MLALAMLTTSGQICASLHNAPSCINAGALWSVGKGGWATGRGIGASCAAEREPLDQVSH